MIYCQYHPASPWDIGAHDFDGTGSAVPSEFDVSGAEYYAVAPAGYSYDGTQDANYSTRKYNTLSDAEAALPATATTPLVINIIGDWTGILDSTLVVISGVTTTASNYILIRAIGIARHQGVWSDSGTFYRLGVPSRAMRILVHYVRVDGLLIRRTDVTVAGASAVEMSPPLGDANAILSNCIVRGIGVPGWPEIGIGLVTQPNQTVVAYNCVVYTISASGSSTAIQTEGDSSGDIVYLYSCTAIGGIRGVARINSTLIAKNCYARGANDAYWGSPTMTKCASSDATGSADLQNIAHDISNFTNVTSGSEDYTLVSGSPLIDTGVDTSAEAAPLNFTTDIAGKSRHSGAGATHTAASTSRADVGTAYAACVDGDTLAIPAGTSTWATGLTVTKAITIQGDGIGSTIIKDGLATGEVMNVSLVANLNTRITGIEFQNDGSIAATPRFVFNGTNIDNRRIRVDNCKFSSLNGTCFSFYTCLGVVDHNTIIGKASGQQVFVAFVFGSAWGYAQGSLKWGDGAWAEADNFGTDKFIFFEDNTITSLYSANLTAIDGHSGARYVFRHNNMQGGHLEMHGFEAYRARSGRAYEFYNNNLTDNGTSSTPYYMRGGVGVIHDETITGFAGGGAISLIQFPLTGNVRYPMGPSDGRNAWDVNDGGNPFGTGTAISAGTLTVTVAGTPWSTNQWVGHAIRKTSGKAVSSATQSAGLCTVVCPSHGFSTGDLVSLFGANEYGWTGIFSITVTDPNTFTFSPAGFLPTSPATGTIKACLGSYFANVNSNTNNTITFEAEGHGVAYDCVFAAADTFEFNKVIHSIDQPGAGMDSSNLNGVDIPALPGGWSQATSPWYEWNNTADGGDIDFQIGSGATTYYTIVSGTHYHNDTTKPGYTPYTYPHPLA